MAAIAGPRVVNLPGGMSTPQDTTKSHPYTCNTCQVAFRNGDLQRSHMRTDWHRYNLKRRVASLPPISAETFADKVLTAQATSNAVAAKASFEKSCPPCSRTYYSENAYENHVKSKNHKTRIVALAGEATTEDGDNASVMSSTISLGEPISVDAPTATTVPPPTGSFDLEAEKEFSQVVHGIKSTTLDDEPVNRRPSRPHHSSAEQRPEHPLSPEKSRTADVIPEATSEKPQLSDDDASLCHCFFCNETSPNVTLNVEHMTKTHGLFLPEQKYLIDLKGLIGWLWDRVDTEHECLYCHKSKSTAEAARDHMRDLGHCRIAFEEEEDMIQVGQFYDFSSTYSDVDDDGDEDMQADWESDEDMASDEADEELTDPITINQGLPSDVQSQVLDNELYLPSGKVAGHRSLNKYFRQNLHNHPTPSEQRERQQLAIENTDTSMTNTSQSQQRQVRGRERALRGSSQQSQSQQLTVREQGMLGVSDVKKREVVAVEKREVRRAQRAMSQYQWGVNKRGNSQKHFRDPLLQ